jgi:hypothetical protein
LSLNFIANYIYDAGDDRFTDDQGRIVTPQQMLDTAFDEHWATTHRRFVWRWRIGSAVRWIARQAVWRAQDALLWLLMTLYDVELALKDELPDPFHKFRRSEFRRTKEKRDGKKGAEGGMEDRSHFFGFQSSRQNLFTNLVVLAGVSALLYRYAPRDGILGTVYRNNALTTAALVLAFFLADLLGPWLLIMGICGLSRLRPLVMFIIRKVKV